MRPSVIACDIDGCLADVRDIVSKYLPDWDEYYRHQMECSLIPQLVPFLNQHVASGGLVVIVTGRPESVRSVTESWLGVNGVSLSKLLMRPTGTSGGTQGLKMGWFEEIRPNLIIDDDPAVVELATKAGFTVLQVHGFRWSGVRDYAPGEVVPQRSTDGHFSFVRNSANNQTPMETLRVLTYEVGDMNKAIHYAERYPEARNAYQPELRMAACQAFCMLRMFCEQQGWSVDDLFALGEENYMEKMQDIKRYGKPDGLKKESVTNGT